MRNIQRIRSLATTPMTFTAANTYIGQVGELVSVFDDSDGTAVALRIHDGNTVGGLLYYQINSYVAPEDTGTSGVVSDNSGTSIKDAVYGGWLNENVIDYSAYFDGSSYLSRTPTVQGNENTFTLSMWVKFSNPSYHGIYTSGNDNGNVERFYFTLRSPAEGFEMLSMPNGSSFRGRFTAAPGIYDSLSYYHLIMSTDTTQNQYKIYLNGKEAPMNIEHAITTDGTSVNRAGRIQMIGVDDAMGAYFEGYMANIQMIDGAALDASYFGETVEGNWIHKPYDGTSTVEGATPVSGLSGTNDKYGTNGFHLNFANESNLGKDVSGNGNDWT